MQRLRHIQNRLAIFLLITLFGCCTPSVTGSAAPAVLTLSPVAATSTACPTAIITANFSEAINPATVNTNTFQLKTAAGASVTGTVTLSAATNTATFTPAALLLPGTGYTATVTTGVDDVYGNPLPIAATSSFTTAANGCHPPPTLLSIVPTGASTGACPNAAVVATFSEPMNPATINAADFTLSPGVVGTITHDATNSIYTLTPSASLAAATLYTINITTAAQDTYGNSLTAPIVSTFTTAANSCMPPPTILSTTPAANATGVCPNRIITANFSEAMNPTTINANTFTVTGTAPVAGVITYNNTSHQAIFTPNASLPLNTNFTGTITTGAQDTFGNPLAAPYVFTFATGANTCLPPAPPTSVVPAAGATGVCTSAVAAATFPQAMNPATITTGSFTLTPAGGAPVAATIAASNGNKTFTLTPTAALAVSTTYTATFTTAVTDSFGNALAAPFSWTFTTGAIACGGTPTPATPPTVTAVSPLPGAIGVCSNSVVLATFSKQMDPTSITTATFFLTPTVAATVTLDSTGKVATLTPSAPLALNQLYTATITTGARDTTGNALAAPYTWTFTTTQHTCQAPVPLATAGNFEVLAGTTVTNAGGTVITGGDLGLTPGSAVTGFPPGTLTPPAAMHITDAPAAQAQSDLTTAYNYAAGLQGGSVLPADLTGLTLTQGLYTNASSVTLSAGAVTLDGQGNPNAVFIFQIGTGLNLVASTQVLLTNGAQAKNVFWQVGSSATLGTNTVFKGTILSLTSISAANGSNIVGRLLTRNGAVTLDTNAVTAP